MNFQFLPGGDDCVLHGDTLRLNTTTKSIILVPMELQDRVRLLSGWYSTSNIPVNIGMLVNLKVIDLSRCTNLVSLPGSICTLEKLEILNLANTKIWIIPGEIGRLQNLRELNASNCRKIRTLPSTLWKLKKLEKMNLAMTKLCSGLPDQIGELASLKELDVSWCKKIESVPATIGQLERLEVLYLYGTNLLELPTEVGNLLALRNLDLSFNRRLRALPPSIGSLSNLAILRLYGVSDLAHLPNEIGQLSSLRLLDLSRCVNLESLPSSLGRLENLDVLGLSGVRGLSDVGEICGQGIRVNENIAMSCKASYVARTNTPFYVPLEFQGRITILILTHYNWTGLPECVLNMKRLKEIELCYCENLEALPEDIGELLPNLEVLSLSQTNLSRLPYDIWRLSNLRKLELWHCENIRYLPISIGQLTKLETLSLKHCTNLLELPGTVGLLNSLRILDLGHCENIRRLPPTIDGLRKLETLNLQYTNLRELPESISDLPNILPNIRTLNLRGCEGLATLPVSFGRGLGTLEELNLSFTNLSQLPQDFGNNYTNLTSLDLARCPNIGFISPTIFEQLQKLETLGLDATHLQNRGFPEEIRNLPRLVKVHLSLSVDANLPQNIGDLNHLRELELRYAHRLIDTVLPSIAFLKNLEKLSISNRDLSHLPSDIHQLQNLQHLDLFGCPNIRSLPLSLGRLTKLKVMRLHIDTLAKSSEKMPTLETLTRLVIGYHGNSGNTNWRDLVKTFLKKAIGSCPNLLCLLTCDEIRWDREEFFWFESIFAARRARARYGQVPRNMWHHLISNPKSFYDYRYANKNGLVFGFFPSNWMQLRCDNAISPVETEVVYRALVEESSNLLQAIVEYRQSTDETEE